MLSLVMTGMLTHQLKQVYELCLGLAQSAIIRQKPDYFTSIQDPRDFKHICCDNGNPFYFLKFTCSSFPDPSF